jgi:hypothetical protein
MTAGEISPGDETRHERIDSNGRQKKEIIIIIIIKEKKNV